MMSDDLCGNDYFPVILCFCMFLVGYPQTHKPVIPPGRLAQIDLSCVDVP